MSDKSRRPFAFVLILILAIVAFVSLRPDSTENKNAASSTPANASRQQPPSASTIDAKSEAPSAGAIASGNKSAYPGGMSQFAPVLPYILMVLILIFRPRGLLGRRDT